MVRVPPLELLVLGRQKFVFWCQAATIRFEQGSLEESPGYRAAQEWLESRPDGANSCRRLNRRSIAIAGRTLASAPITPGIAAAGAVRLRGSMVRDGRCRRTGDIEESGHIDTVRFPELQRLCCLVLIDGRQPRHEFFPFLAIAVPVDRRAGFPHDRQPLRYGEIEHLVHRSDQIWRHVGWS